MLNQGNEVEDKQMSQERFESLDGLRGVAALAVVVDHFFSAYIPAMVNDEPALRAFISETPIAILYNGPFAVSIFFVLSGFVVSNSAARRGVPILFNLIQRYFRLALPSLAGVLFAWALFALFPHELALLKTFQENQALNWFYDGSEPGILSAIGNGLYGVFEDGTSKYNSVLWTMKIEFISSAAIYLFYHFTAPRFRSTLLIVICLFTMFILRQQEYATFAVGALFREAKVAGLLPRRFLLPSLIFGIFFGSMMQGYGIMIGIRHVPECLNNFGTSCA